MQGNTLKAYCSSICFTTPVYVTFQCDINTVKFFNYETRIMTNLLRQVTLDRASRKKDKSVTLTFITSLEQSSEDFLEVDKLLDTTGLLYFKSEGNLTTSELDELDAIDLEIEGKTKSQRLRNTLYVMWEQKFKQYSVPTFKDFYATEMEKVIEHYKGKLE